MKEIHIRSNSVVNITKIEREKDKRLKLSSRSAKFIFALNISYFDVAALSDIKVVCVEIVCLFHTILRLSS